jgi:hypothetical protein
MQQLNADYLFELAKAAIEDKNFFSLVKQYMRKEYMPNEQLSKVYDYMFNYFDANDKIPSIGVIAQSFSENSEVLSVIAKIKTSHISDIKDGLLKTFEKFIKEMMFVYTYERTKDLYNEGKHDEAISLLAEEAEKIAEFAIVSQRYTKVFEGFDDRQELRQAMGLTESKVHKKIPTGIPQFDHYTYGGQEIGTAKLVISRSGIGKSTYLRQCGYHAAYMGNIVVHFQAEGKEEEVSDAYDSMWTNIPLVDMQYGRIPEKYPAFKLEEARKAILSNGGEIIVVPFDKFGTASIADCRAILLEIMKTHNVSSVIFDYLELFDPGNGKKYSPSDEGERWRKKHTSQAIVNIATEFHLAVITATQSNDVPEALWNDPQQVITRSNIANLRATIDAFPYCVTLNQTKDEDDNGVMRIHVEKLRKYKVSSSESTFKIAQGRNRGKLVDIPETYKKFWNKDLKRPKNEAIREAS